MEFDSDLNPDHHFGIIYIICGSETLISILKVSYGSFRTKCRFASGFLMNGS